MCANAKRRNGAYITMNEQLLVQKAFEAQKMSYSPYSHFCVGAALMTKDGKIYQGCNIESASYSPTNCAERTAYFKAVSEGEREFSMIAIAGGYLDMENTQLDYCSPCGVCRQVMMEFCNPTTFKIIMARSEDDYIVKTLEELLPMGFGPRNL